MIESLQCCDCPVQLAAEPPYRFTFQCRDFEPEYLSARIADKNGNTVWKTEKQPYRLPYVRAETDLNRLEEYTFSLSLTDRNGGEEQARLHFHTGLLGDFENAALIGAAFSDCAPVIHKTFTAEPGDKAVLYLLTLGFSVCYINGVLISGDLFGVNSDYHKREDMKLLYPLNDTFSYSQYYRAYDVSEFLEQGENHIAVVLGNGWYNQTSRIAEGHMEYGDVCFKLLLDVGRQPIVSDESFEAFESPIVYNQLFVGEIRDAREPFAPLLFGDGDPHPIQIFVEKEAVLRAAHFPADRVVKRVTPTLIAERENQKIYDVGFNCSGRVELVTSCESGEKITLTFSERLDGTALSTRSAGETVQTDVFIASGKESEKFSPLFVWHGFRYFCVEGYVTDVSVEVIEADLQPRGYLRTGNPTLDEVIEMYQRSQWSNIHCGVPSDCPHRERLGYTGDGQLTCSAAMYLSDMRSLYRKWMRDIADGQCRNSGHVQHTAPFGGGGGGPAGWGGAVIVLPWNYYLHYGETDFLGDYYAPMLRYSEYMESRSVEDIIVREEEGGWCLGEWCPPGSKVALSPEYVNTCLYIEQLGLLRRISLILGEEERAAALEAQIERKRRAVTDRFFSAGVWDCGRQGAPLFAYAAGIIDLEALREFLEEYKTGSLDVGIFGLPILIAALFDAEMADTAVRLLCREESPSFGFMLKSGATTLWENFSGGSNNHPMFGGFVSVLIERLLGIRLNEETVGFTGDFREPAVPGCKGKIFTPNGYLTIE